MNNGLPEKPWPMTVEEAVNRILSELPEEDVEIIRNTPSALDMVRFHHGLGTWVRNTFGLWEGNKELFRSCGLEDPDGVSYIILAALWNELQRK